MGLIDDLIQITLRNGRTTGGQASRAGTTPNANSQGTLAAKVATLKKLGYNDRQIQQLIGQNITGSGVDLGFGGNISLPDVPGSAGNPALQAATGLGSLFANMSVGSGTRVPGYPSKGGGSSGSKSTAANILGRIFGPSNNSASRALVDQGTRIANDPGVQKRVGGIINGLGGMLGGLVPGNAGGTGRQPGKRGPANQGGIFDQLSGMEYPTWDYQAPQITMRDFTPQAQSQVEQAFAPLYAAYAQQRQAAQTKSDRDLQIVGDLYNKYVGSIGQAGQETQQRYDTAQADRSQQGQQLASGIGDYYQSANANTAGLLGGIGAQQAAPELLQQGANEQAVQQSQAAGNTQAVNDYYEQQQQGAANQTSAYQDAARNEGVRGQANVLADLSSILGNIGTQEAGSRTQAGMTALDIAQQLANRDLQTQQQNAQMGLENYTNQYQGRVGQYGASRQNILDQLAQSNWEREFGQKDYWNRQNYGLDRDKLIASTQGGGGIDPTGVNSTQQQLAQRFGGNTVNDIAKAMYDVTTGSGVRPGDQNMANAYNAFFQRANGIAANNGLTTAEVIQAMQAYWQATQAGSFGAVGAQPQPKF